MVNLIKHNQILLSNIAGFVNFKLAGAYNTFTYIILTRQIYVNKITVCLDVCVTDWEKNNKLHAMVNYLLIS